MKKYRYTLYLTNSAGKLHRFLQNCWTIREIQFRMGWTAYRTKKAIKTGEPTKAGKFWWVIVKKHEQ